MALFGVIYPGFDVFFMEVKCFVMTNMFFVHMTVSRD